MRVIFLMALVTILLSFFQRRQKTVFNFIFLIALPNNSLYTAYVHLSSFIEYFYLLLGWLILNVNESSR